MGQNPGLFHIANHPNGPSSFAGTWPSAEDSNGATAAGRFDGIFDRRFGGSFVSVHSSLTSF